MHILLGIIGFLAAIGIWSYRLQMAKRGFDETRKMAEAARNMPRKMRFKSKTGKSGLDVVTDPREAVAIMMLEIARASGEVTAEHKAEIRAEIIQYFDMNDASAEELIVQAGWLTREGYAPHVVMERMTRIVLNTPSLGPEQFVDVSTMLDEVALVDGGPSREQVELIGIYRSKSGLRV